MILGENKNNTIRSKGELNTYFSAGLKRFPNLKFKIIGFTVGDNKVILEYSANLDGKSLSMSSRNSSSRTNLKKSGVYYGIEQAIVNIESIGELESRIQSQ